MVVLSKGFTCLSNFSIERVVQYGTAIGMILHSYTIIELHRTEQHRTRLQGKYYTNAHPRTTRVRGLRQKLRKPLESIRVSHSSNNGAHVQLDGASSGSIRTPVLSIRVHQSELIFQFVLAGSTGHVDLISEDQKGNVLQFLRGQKSIQLLLCLGESAPVDSIYYVNNSVHGGEIILPQTTRGLVTSEIKGLKFDVANDQFVRVGMQCGNVYLHSVLFQHVKQGCLSGVIETKKQNLGILVVKTYNNKERRQGKTKESKQKKGPSSVVVPNSKSGMAIAQ